MLRYTFLSVILWLSVHCLLAQTDQPDANELLAKYQNANNDTNKITVCLNLSNYYLFKENRLNSDVDSAFLFLNEAQILANRIKNEDMRIAALSVLGNYYVITGDWERGRSLSKKAIDYYHSSKNYLQEANSWNQLGQSISETNSFYAKHKLQSFENARQLFTQLSQPMQTAATLKHIALCHAKQRRFDSAEYVLKQAVQIYRSLNNNTKVLETYNTLAEISEYETDHHKQLLHRLELVRLVEATADTVQAAYHYAKLALAYAHASLYNESLTHILRALDILKRNKQYDDFYGDLSLAIFDYIELGKPETALNYLLAVVKEVPPQNLAHEVDLNEMLGKCYAAMKQYTKAEKYYLNMMKLFSTTQNTNLYSTRDQMTIDFIHYNQVIGNFYIKTGQYKKAGTYFNKVFILPPGSIRPITLSKIHLMQFKVDSASHNYVAAISHYQRYKQMEDSLFNVSKDKLIQELNIKYETEKQSKDLQLKQQNIAALTSQTQLQKADLKRAGLTRNIIIASSILLLVLAYLGFRIKQRHNLELQKQQQEINVQNSQLRKLLSVQEKLVTEKEWLLKEVHHRVKNNLHTIISLLETQATFLTDDALAAIQNSQNRIFAMSLIHQKLYQVEGSTSINMAVYLPELLVYLQESFNVQHRINFKTDIDSVELDITQAIPIGLIFNEATTNAIKYAFPDGSTGKIEVVIKQINDKTVRLSIEDNGIGLPANWKQKMNSSLGLKLMHGLCEDIQASFNIETTQGTKVTIEFDKLGFRVFRNASEK